MSREYDETNRFKLFHNDRPNGPNSAQVQGSINIDGREYWLNGWWGKEGSKLVMSGSVRPKDQQGGYGGGYGHGHGGHGGHQSGGYQGGGYHGGHRGGHQGPPQGGYGNRQAYQDQAPYGHQGPPPQHHQGPPPQHPNDGYGAPPPRGDLDDEIPF
ncbi:MAG: hypothetical protein NXI16_01535 [Alphaproteobacteria bacterium]|nr:hypothetical protein [Alphaproteobacteria bacterium]